MLTMKDKFSEMITLAVKNGACTDEKSGIPFLEEILKLAPEDSIEACWKISEPMLNGQDDFCSWYVIACGRELDDEVRSRIVGKITNPVMAANILKRCDFLSVTEKTGLEVVAKNKVEIQKCIDKITDPMEAAKLLIDYPHLTDTQELELKAIFEGRLPTVEKELEMGVVVTAKSQVVK